MNQCIETRRPRRRNRRQKPKPDTRMPIAVECHGEIIEQTARSVTIEQGDGQRRVLPKTHVELIDYVDGIQDPQFRHGVEFKGIVATRWIIVKVFGEKADYATKSKQRRKSRRKGWR